MVLTFVILDIDDIVLILYILYFIYLLIKLLGNCFLRFYDFCCKQLSDKRISSKQLCELIGTDLA